MRHRKDQAKLGRTASHRKAMLSNMVTSFFAAGRIETTIPKARAARRVAERMITFARTGTLAARRRVARIVRDETVLKKLFDEIAPQYATRPGGYTRILKLAKPRLGDCTPMAILELVGKEDEGRRKKAARKTYHREMGAHVKTKREAAETVETHDAAAPAPKAETKRAAHPKPRKMDKAAAGAKKAHGKPKKAMGK